MAENVRDAPRRVRWSRAGRSPGLVLLLGMLVLAAPGGAAPPVATPSVDELIAKATRQGPLRVVVELKIDAPGPPSREAIARTQDLVLQELAGTNHRVIRRFATIPFLALLASAEALQRLAGSLFVAGIREDTVMRLPGPRLSP